MTVNPSFALGERQRCMSRNIWGGCSHRRARVHVVGDTPPKAISARLGQTGFMEGAVMCGRALRGEQGAARSGHVRLNEQRPS